MTSTQQTTFQEQIAGASDSHVRTLALQENKQGSQEQEVAYISKLLTCSKAKKEADRPEWLFAENVKNLLSINDGWDFARVLTEMDEAGYDCQWQVLNSKDFGVPQNRERVFIVGHLRSRGAREVFPITGNDGLVDKQVDRLQDTRDIACALRATDYKGTHNMLKVNVLGNTNPSGNGMNGQVYSSDGLAPTLTTNKGEGNKIAIPVPTPDRTEKRQNGRRFKEDGEPMFTLTGQDGHGVMILEDFYKGREPREYTDNCPTLRADRQGLKVADGFRIRKLLPIECFRLQGFPDEYFYKAQAVNSDSQLYKQVGNSVTVNVIYEIARRLT